MRKIAVIPAYEPPESFAFYAAQVLQSTDVLVVVNDGSSQEYDAVFDKIKHLEGAAVLSHDKNMVAIHTGKEITVEFDRPTPLQIDGETVLDVTKYAAKSAR